MQHIIDIQTQEDVTVVGFAVQSIGGVGGVEELSVELRKFIAEHRPMKMVIDFGQVRFLSSQMLGLLVDVWRRLGEYQGRMIISGINPQLNRVFKITNLDKIFEFCPNKDEAVRRLTPNADNT